MNKNKNTVNIPLFLCGILLLFLVSALVAYIPAGAQPPTYLNDPNKELDDRVKPFFDELILGNTSKAFDDLLRTSPGSEKLAEMGSKLESMKTQFGSVRKFEKVGAKNVGEDLVFLRYLLKYDRHPVLWTFTFYRRPGESGTTAAMANPWAIIGLRFDTNLDPLLQDGASGTDAAKR